MSQENHYSSFSMQIHSINFLNRFLWIFSLKIALSIFLLNRLYCYYYEGGCANNNGDDNRDDINGISYEQKKTFYYNFISKKILISYFYKRVENIVTCVSSRPFCSLIMKFFFGVFLYGFRYFQFWNCFNHSWGKRINILIKNEMATISILIRGIVNILSHNLGCTARTF